jgi:hypothetical protein
MMMHDEYGNSYLDGRLVRKYSGPPLDAAGAEAILGPYPELWERWKKEMLGPEPPADMGPGDVRRWHSPEYLNEVVSEYLWLQTGGDEVSPELEARCQEVAATDPRNPEYRREYLTDPWRRALGRLDAENSCWDWKDRSHVRYYYDPDAMAAGIKAWKELMDPYSEASLRTRESPWWTGSTEPEGMAPWN